MTNDMTTDERRRFVESTLRHVAERFRGGAVVGIVVALALAGLGHLTYPAALRPLIVVACGSVAVSLGVCLALMRLPFFERSPNLLICPLGVVTATAAGAISAKTGGFDSVWTSVIYLIWIFGSVVAPLPPREFVLDIVLQYIALCAAILLGAETLGSPFVFVGMSVSGAALFLIGIYLRERASTAQFVTQLRLDEANRLLEENQRSLTRLNQELEIRVEEQVAEGLRRARDIQALNDQLQLRVAERSRELAAALARLAHAAPQGPQKLELNSVVAERVRIVRLLDAGGMGEVYEGYDLIGLRSVAVKMIHARRATDIANLYRFLTEASAAASIAHPAVVKTVHLDVADDGRLFQILELVDGETVASRIARGAFLRPHEAARVGAILADALATAHAAGVVHRDIKPSNVMLTASEPGVKILDFGLCKLEDDELSVGGAPLTRTGHIMGTPAYMSPEQIQDPQSVTSSTDVYSLGLLLFELVMGVPPFDAQSPADFFMAHTQCEPRHLAPLEMEGAAELDAIVHAALQKNPTARPSARELAERLAALADARDVPSADELVRGHQRALSAATAEMRMPDPSATSVTGIPELAALAEAPEDHAFAADADRETVGSEPVVSSTSRPSASLAVSGERPTRTSEKWKRARG